MKQSSILMTFLKIFYFSVILCSTFKCIVCFFNYKNGIFKSKFLKGGQYLNRVSGSISTPFNDFKYSPKLSKSIEDNINHIVLIESLNSETFDQAKTNKLLYEWLIVNFKVLFPLIHKYEAGFDDVLILLQNTKPSVVSATILSSSPVNVSATVKVLVKPYMIIPSLLERKESMLKEILSYVINVSDVNQNMIKMLGAFHNMAVDTTSGLVALKSILSLDDPENSQNNVIQTQINNPYSIDDSDFLLPAFNEFMCKYVIDQLLSTFDSMFPSAPTELDAAAGGESEYDRALLKQFQVWAQSTDFALRRTNTKQKMYYLSPLTLFYTFLEENNHFKGTFDDNDKTHTNKLVSVSYIYSLIVSSISKKIVQVLSMSMLQKHYSYVKYYNEVLTTLELSSVTGPSFTVHNSELIDPSHQHTFVKRLGDAMHYPSLEVRLQGMALTDAEKDSFLLTYVTKILNTTAFKTNNNNDDDDGSSEGVSAGNPNTDRDGAAAGGSGEVNRVSDFLSSSGDIKVMFPFPLDRGSDPTQTKTSAAGWRKPPGVKILDPPRNRPPPPPPAEKDTYIDDSESPQSPYTGEIQVVQCIDEVYAQLGDDTHIRIVDSKEEDGERYALLQCQSSRIGLGYVLNKWIKYSDLERRGNGDNSSSAAADSSGVQSQQSGGEEGEDDMLVTIPPWPTQVTQPQSIVTQYDDDDDDSSWACNNPFDNTPHP